LFLIGSSHRNLDSCRGSINTYFLGPVGISGSSEFIAAESQRIPFKAALSKPHEWQDAFKNWPLPPIAGWRNWYKRMLDDDNSKTSNWDSLRIAHCLELSLAETPKNENLLIAACHFWSNGANAFLFGRCIHDNRPLSHRNCISTQVQGLLQANRSRNRGWI
jgi:hypothetical protein